MQICFYKPTGAHQEVELEKELDDAAKAFLADDNVRVMPTSGTPAKLEVLLDNVSIHGGSCT